MSYVFEGTNGNYCEAFIDSLRKLRDHGRVSSPRGQKTLELDHVTFKIDPRKSLFTSPIRNLNFFFLIAENLWYWSGRNSTELPSYYIKNYRSFSDEGIHQGAYGPMILEQIRYVVNQLKEDQDTRQAVMTLWRPNPQTAKDKPCTLLFDFKIRDGKLNMHATMRSNDAIWGNNYDMPSFSMLQIAIAGILGIEPGFLYLTAHSYHVYERHFDLMYELIKEEWNYTEYPFREQLLTCNVSNLEEHLKNIDELLSYHYLLRKNVELSGQGYCQVFGSFYNQFEHMIELFHDQGTSDQEYSINSLLDIGSPFGTIYYERHNTKK